MADDVSGFKCRCYILISPCVRVVNIYTYICFIYSCVFDIPLLQGAYGPLCPIHLFSRIPFSSLYIRQVTLPILLGIKAIIIEIKTLFYSLFYGYLCVKLVNNAIVEVVKTGGNIQLKGGCY